MKILESSLVNQPFSESDTWLSRCSFSLTNFIYTVQSHDLTQYQASRKDLTYCSNRYSIVIRKYITNCLLKGELRVLPI